MTWNSFFNLPHNCLLSLPLTKKSLMEQPDILASDIRLLQGTDVQSIFIVGRISQQMGNVAPYVDEEVAYHEILYIKATLHDNAFDIVAEKLSLMLHKLIPHHCVIILQSSDENKNSLSLATKRIARNNANLRVIEQLYHSGLITDQQSDFLSSLSFDNSNKINQKEYYNYLASCFDALQLAEITNKFALRPIEVTKQMLQLQQSILAKEEEIEKCIKQLTRDTQMAERVRINTEINRLKNNVVQIKEELEELNR